MFVSDKNYTLWTYQQDSATLHTANLAQKWCREHLFKFWSKEMWSPCFPDLNPMDCSVWSLLKARVCGKIHCTIDNLKYSLEIALQEIPQ